MPLPLFRSRATLLAQQAGGFAIEFCGLYTQPGSLTTFVFPWVRLGRPHWTREILVTSSSRNGTTTPRTISSAFLYGSGFSALAGVVQAGVFSIGGSTTSALRFTVPQGIASAALSITHSGAVADSSTIAGYRLVNRESRGTNDTDFSGNGGASGTSIAVSGTTINPGGFLLGIGGQANANATTVTGAEKVESILPTTGLITSCWRRGDSVAVTPTVTLAWTGSAGSIWGCWSWNP